LSAEIAPVPAVLAEDAFAVEGVDDEAAGVGEDCDLAAGAAADVEFEEDAAGFAASCAAEPTEIVMRIKKTKG